MKFDLILQGAVNVIRTREPFQGEALEVFDTLIEEMTQFGQPLAVLDLSDIPIISGQGLEVLIEVKNQFIKRGGNFKLAAPSLLLKDVLRITALEDQFEIFEQVTDAVGSYVR